MLKHVNSDAMLSKTGTQPEISLTNESPARLKEEPAKPEKKTFRQKVVEESYSFQPTIVSRYKPESPDKKKAATQKII